MKANEAKHTFTAPKNLCFSLVFASCYKCSQQTRSYSLLDFSPKKNDNLLRLMIGYLNLKTQGDDENL